MSFASSATVDAPLITSVADLKAAVSSISAGGSTNHADAFEKATDLFDPASPNGKVIVMFTDGETTSGPPPAPVAAAARAQGIIIYCIGLIGSDGIDVNVLNEWATDPDSSHVAVTPDDSDLEELFADLAANISKPGATDIIINEEVTSDFVITGITPPTKGSAMSMGSRSLRWSIPELGVTENEGASLEFFIKHVSQVSGTKKVNQSIEYSDNEGNTAIFPDPTVSVNCDVIVHPEPCPVPLDLTIDGCEDTAFFNMGDVYMESQSRILELEVTVRHVCPGKRVALAAILTEIDSDGGEHQRGMKTMTIPAHSYKTCRDVHVKGIRFVLPEDLSLTGECPCSTCSPRNFKVRFLANNIDSGYSCSD